MSGEQRYYSNLPKRPRSTPKDALPAAGVLADLAVPKSIIGIAFPHTQIGGHRPGDDWSADDPPVEVVWRLVLDRGWVGGKTVDLPAKLTLEGRYVLRQGEFVELAEDAT